MEIRAIFGLILFVIILALVVYALMIQGVSEGFDSVFNIFGDWTGKLFSSS